MKRINVYLLALFFAIGLAACVSAPEAEVYEPVAEAHEPAVLEVVVPSAFDDVEEVTEEENSPEAEESAESSRIIAIIRNGVRYPKPGENWAEEIVYRHGSENVLVFSWPRRAHDYYPVISDLLNEISGNPEIGALIINHAASQYIVQ